MNSMLNNWPIDPAVVIIALGVITLLLLIMTVICIMQTSRLYRRYDYFMRGKDAESMEEIILNLSDEIKELKSQDRANKDVMRTLSKNVKGSYQKFGMVKYNVLKAAATLDIQTICPLHGPILTENLGHYLEKYDIWSSYKVESEGVMIAYTSVYGNTKKAVELLAQKLEEKGCPKVVVCDLAREDMAEAVEDAFRTNGKLQTRARHK